MGAKTELLGQYMVVANEVKKAARSRRRADSDTDIQPVEAIETIKRIISFLNKYKGIPFTYKTVENQDGSTGFGCIFTNFELAQDFAELFTTAKKVQSNKKQSLHRVVLNELECDLVQNALEQQSRSFTTTKAEKSMDGEERLAEKKEERASKREERNKKRAASAAEKEAKKESELAAKEAEGKRISENILDFLQKFHSSYTTSPTSTGDGLSVIFLKDNRLARNFKALFITEYPGYFNSRDVYSYDKNTKYRVILKAAELELIKKIASQKNKLELLKLSDPQGEPANPQGRPLADERTLLIKDEAADKPAEPASPRPRRGCCIIS